MLWRNLSSLDEISSKEADAKPYIDIVCISPRIHANADERPYRGRSLIHFSDILFYWRLFKWLYPGIF